MNSPAMACLFSLLMVLSLPAMAGVAVADSSDGNASSVSTIDADHGLADRAALDEFRTQGNAEGDLGHLDGTITVAEKRQDVGIEDQLFPNNVRNDFVRIQYDEDFERTLRIHVPRDYWVPYSQADVRSASSDHTADYQPVRGGEYLEIVVHVDGPSDIVLPIQRDSSLSYRAVERVDNRVEWATGHAIFSGDEWTYLRSDELIEDTAFELTDVEDVDDAAIQYDAEKQDPAETWLNAPDSDDGSGVYVMTRGGGDNQTTYVVATDDDPPDVRYKPEADIGDRESGYINDARQIPERISDVLGDAWPFSVGVIR